jgi:hypothetical protein
MCSWEGTSKSDCGSCGCSQSSSSGNHSGQRDSDGANVCSSCSEIIG